MTHVVRSIQSTGLAVAGAALFVAFSSRAEPVDRVEVIPFQTLSPTTQQFLAGDKAAKPSWIAGELRLPKPGPEKVPAVVLVHGSGGMSSRQERWVSELNDVGIATFKVDSFSGRGIVTTVTDQAQVSNLAMMVDAYRALAILAGHPRIDRSRISILGFSKGAIAAVYSATTRFQKMYGPADAAFAAHIGLYTPCNTQYRDDEKVTATPIRLFHGIADDWVAIGPCRAYVERLKKAGADATLTEFPGAVHAYDSFTFAKPLTFPHAQTTRNCLLREGDGGEVLNVSTGKPFDYSDPCVERGPRIAYDRAAHEATLLAVKELLTAKVVKRP
jgi:dienelactone hydrolase